MALALHHGATDTDSKKGATGRIVTRASTSVRQLNPMSSPIMTHGTTFYPAAGSDNVLFASGDFSGFAAGRVILRGAVNMDRFAIDNIIAFDCHFLIKPSGK